jgi:hypothetical protein
MNPIKILADLVSGLAALFRFREKKQELENRPEMHANDEAKQIQADRDHARAVIRNGKPEDLTRDLS